MSIIKFHIYIENIVIMEFETGAAEFYILV